MSDEITTEGKDDVSMVELQKLVTKRVNEYGKKIQPPRTQQQRPKAQGMNPAANVAKSAAKKWALGLGASMLIGGSAAATYYFLF